MRTEQEIDEALSYAVSVRDMLNSAYKNYVIDTDFWYKSIMQVHGKIRVLLWLKGLEDNI